MTNTWNKRLVSAVMIGLLFAALILLAISAPVVTARATEPDRMVLEQVVTTTAATETASGSGIFRSIEAGDTFTVTYKLVENDGFVEGFFTPKYDEEAFALTSFSVDTDNWSMMNSYGHPVYNPLTEGYEYVEMTAAEFIAEHNAALAAGEEPYTQRLIFNVYFDEERDDEGTTSDTFLTLVYTALVDMDATTASTLSYSFGFDLSDDGMFTHAAKDTETLLDILYKADANADPAAISDAMYTLWLRAEISAEISEGQTVSFRYDQIEGFYLDLDDIALEYLVPADPAPYFAEDGDFSYLFYTDDDDATVLADLPDVPGTYYVKAVFTATTHYEGAETARVAITIAPMHVDAPELLLYAKGVEEPFEQAANYSLAAGEAVYGTDLTLNEVVGSEEAAYLFPAGGDLLFTYEYQAAGAQDYVACENPFLSEGNLTVGSYRVTVGVRDQTYMSFSDDPSVKSFTVTFSVTPATLTLHALVDNAPQKTVTYGANAPALTPALSGVVEGDDEDELLEALDVTVTSDNAYQKYSPVSNYYYHCVAASSLTNYTLAYESATLTVERKALTLTAEYEKGVVTFEFGGVVNDDEVGVTIDVDGVELAGLTYTCSSIDYEKRLASEAVTATVTPDVNSTNYKAGTLILRPVYKVDFLKGEGFGAALNMPLAQYVYEDCRATLPDETPTFARYAFSYWALDESAFEFATADVAEDIDLVAVWEQMKYLFRFRALNGTASYDSGNYRELAWQNDELSETAVVGTYYFTKNTLLPTVDTIKGFRVKRWIAVIPQVGEETIYREARFFDVDVSVESTEGAYYLAEMTLDVGRGDVNGDGDVTIEDVLAMKRYLVGVAFNKISSEQQAWDVASEETPEGGYFFMHLWDVNGDTFKDSRDIVTIRDALVTGYGYTVVTDTTADGTYVTGGQIALEEGVNYAGEVIATDDLDDLGELLFAGKSAVLTANVEAEEDIYLSYDGDVTLYLGGYTFTVPHLTVVASGKITLAGGVLDGEISFTAAGGVFISDVKDGQDNDISANGSESFVYPNA